MVSDYQIVPVPTLDAVDSTRILKQFETTEKISYECEFVWNKGVENCGDFCSFCDIITSCPNSGCNNMERCLEDAHSSSCAYHNTCYSQSGCRDCVDYRLYCTLDSANTQLCPSYMGNCPCDSRSMDCGLCNDRFYDVLQEKIDWLHQKLEPTSTYFGIHKHTSEIKDDGSLRNGAEVTTIGRRLNWKYLRQENVSFIDTIMQTAPQNHWRAGGHMHYLLGYNDNYVEFSQAVPTIYLYNLYIMMMYYADSLIWVSSTGPSEEQYTRPLRYRKLYTPLTFRNDNTAFLTRDFVNFISNADERYMFIHAIPSSWERGHGSMNRFHVECRFPDTLLTGTGLTAIQILIGAMMRKAIKIGAKGVLKFNPTRLDRAYRFACRIGGGRDYSYGDSHYIRPLSSSEKKLLVSKTGDFIDWLKPELLFYGQEPYLILKYLAKNPISQQMMDGVSWDEIETQLHRIGNKPNTKAKIAIEKAFNNLALKSNDPSNWIRLFGVRTGIPIKEVTEYFINNRDIVWDSEEGTFLNS
jgi:hypothetical protein